MIVAALVTFVYVILLTLQQLNIRHDNRFWVAPVAFSMAACEVMLIVRIVRIVQLNSGLIVLAMGTGGTLGVLAVMEAGKRLERRT